MIANGVASRASSARPGGTVRVKLGAGKDGSGLLLANDANEPGVHILAKDSGSSLPPQVHEGSHGQL